MKLDEILKSRHSIREYKDKDVDYKLIGTILESAIQSPSSGNVQNWRFIIIKNEKTKNEIAKSCLNQSFMAKSPVHIVICYDKANIQKLFPENHEEFSLQNTAIISTVIMLKATELKLGTCWVSIPDPEKISSILKIPANIKPSVILTLGYPESYYKKTTREPTEILTYFEGYGKKTRSVSSFPIDQSKLKSKIKEKFLSKK